MVWYISAKPIPTDPEKWHSWFAWHPVIFERHGMRHLAWLERLERKYGAYTDGTRVFGWEYRL